MSDIFSTGLDRNTANYTPLSPLTFIERAASVYPDRLAVAHGGLRRTWAQTYDRCRQLASALSAQGIGLGDTVAAMLANTPPMVEAHFGVPMTGAVLNSLNTRLDAESIAFMLDHGEAKAVIVDHEFSTVMRGALELCQRKPLVIDVDDPEYVGPGGHPALKSKMCCTAIPQSCPRQSLPSPIRSGARRPARSSN